MQYFKKHLSSERYRVVAWTGDHHWCSRDRASCGLALLGGAWRIRWPDRRAVSAASLGVAALTFRDRSRSPIEHHIKKWQRAVPELITQYSGA